MFTDPERSRKITEPVGKAERKIFASATVNSISQERKKGER